MSGSAIAHLEANAPALRQALHASCVADEWSATALRCFTAAALPADIDACTAKLTHEQYERIHRKIDPLIAPTASGSAPTPVAPPGPAAGSGSASSAAPPNPATGSGSGSSAAPPGQAAGSAGRSPAGAGAGAARKPAAPRDCSLVVIDPTDPKCRAQYCRTHPDDLRCAE